MRDAILDLINGVAMLGLCCCLANCSIHSGGGAWGIDSFNASYTFYQRPTGEVYAHASIPPLKSAAFAGLEIGDGRLRLEQGKGDVRGQTEVAKMTLGELSKVLLAYIAAGAAAGAAAGVVAP